MNNNEDNVNWDKNNISNNNNSINEEKNNNINKNDLMKKIKTNIYKNKDSSTNNKSNNSDYLFWQILCLHIYFFLFAWFSFFVFIYTSSFSNVSDTTFWWL